MLLLMLLLRKVLRATTIERPTSPIVSVTEASPRPMRSEITSLTTTASSPAHIVVHPASATSATSPHTHTPSTSTHVVSTTSTKPASSPTQRNLVRSRTSSASTIKVLVL